jgi:hypothetical protein
MKKVEDVRVERRACRIEGVVDADKETGKLSLQVDRAAVGPNRIEILCRVVKTLRCEQGALRKHAGRELKFLPKIAAGNNFLCKGAVATRLPAPTAKSRHMQRSKRTLIRSPRRRARECGSGDGMPMTIRGGGFPASPLAFMPIGRMGPPLRSFAADAHDCIVVRVLGPTAYKFVARFNRARKRAPL